MFADESDTRKRCNTEDVMVTQAKKKKEDKDIKRAKKDAEIAAADEMSSQIFRFHNTPTCHSCTELRETLANVNAQCEAMKLDLAEKALEIENLVASKEVKAMVIKNLEDELKLSRPPKESHYGMYYTKTFVVDAKTFVVDAKALYVRYTV